MTVKDLLELQKMVLLLSLHNLKNNNLEISN